MFEEFTEDYFMDQARALGEEYGVDTRQGSLFMDAATGHCIRIAKFMNDLSTAFEMLAVDTCTGDVLTEKAAQDGITDKVLPHPTMRFRLPEQLRNLGADSLWIPNTSS